jgi:hypothetical protein
VPVAVASRLHYLIPHFQLEVHFFRAACPSWNLQMKPPLAGRNRVGIELQILLFPRLRAPEDRPITLGVYLCGECTELWIPSILSVPWQKFTAASLRRHAKLGHQKCVALFRYSYPCMSAGSLALLSSLSYPLLKPLLCSYDVVISGIYMNTDA